MRGSRTRSALLAALLAVLMIVVGSPTAGAHPRLEKVAGQINSGLWRQILAAPLDDQNPFNPGSYGCFEVDGVLAPFTGSAETTSFSCDVRRGQAVLVAGYTVEQSVVEELAADPPRDPSRAGLLKRALGNLPARPSVTFDRRPLRLVQVTGPLTHVALPQPNILGSPDDSTSFVAVGWVAVVRPSPGRHTITITPAPTASVPDPPSVTTYLHVSRRAHRV